jgi:hypothetical protein
VPRSPELKRRITCLLAAVLAFIAWNVAGATEGRREAKAHADRALREYNLGNFEEAISEFGKAYEIEPSPILLFNIGLAHRHLDHFERASFFFRRYLNETGPDAASRNDAERYIQEMESKLAQEKKATDSAPTAPPRSAGPTAPAQPGAVNDGGANVAPLAPAIPAAPRGDTRGPPSASAPASSSSELRTIAWVSGGAAVAALVGGVAFQVASAHNLSEFNSASSGCGVLSDGSIGSKGPDTAAQCASLHDSWSSDKHWAIAGYAVGGALAVTSAVLFLTSRPKSSGVETAVSFTCSPGPAGVVCGGVF